jgi:hypothetical protein
MKHMGGEKKISSNLQFNGTSFFDIAQNNSNYQVLNLFYWPIFNETILIRLILGLSETKQELAPF